MAPVWPANDIETKVEEALVAYLTQATGYATYRGLEPELRALPAVFASCPSVVEVPLDSGNYQCEVDVVLITKVQKDYDESADRLDDFRTRWATVRDALKWDDLNDKLSAAISNFTCFMVLDRGGNTASDSDNFVGTVKLEIHACGTAGLWG